MVPDTMRRKASVQILPQIVQAAAATMLPSRAAGVLRVRLLEGADLAANRYVRDELGRLERHPCHR